MDVKTFLQEVKNNKISIEKNTKDILDEAERLNKKQNFLNTICKDFALKQAGFIEKNRKGKVAGLPITVKDCICVKGVESRAGSRILKGYKPTFNATVVQRLVDEGAIIIGKTSQDEFGFGSFSTNTDNIPKNPYDEARSCGGSSGGAGGFSAVTQYTHVALAESTGGSIVNPASFCGVVGFCPTYGVISRYGLIDYANSLDKIGLIGKTIEDVKIVFDVIKGHDKKDATSLDKGLNKDNGTKKIGVIKESLNVDAKIKDLILKKLNESKIPYDYISLPLTERYGVACYYLIAMSEASTNLAKFCGLRYGFEKEISGDFNEYFSSVRGEGFGKEAKRRIILGTFARMAGFRDAYYLKAMKVRTRIINEYKTLFKKYDLLVSPTMPIIAPRFDEIERLTPAENYMMDVLTVGPNLAGLPHISINTGFVEKMPVGIMFIADHLNEEKLFRIGAMVEK